MSANRTCHAPGWQSGELDRGPWHRLTWVDAQEGGQAAAQFGDLTYRVWNASRPMLDSRRDRGYRLVAHRSIGG